MAMALASSEFPIRANPPDMTSQPLAVLARKTRRLIGRGTSEPSIKAGVVDRVTASWPTSLLPCAAIQSARDCPPLLANRPP